MATKKATTKTTAGSATSSKKAPAKKATAKKATRKAPARTSAGTSSSTAGGSSNGPGAEAPSRAGRRTSTAEIAPTLVVREEEDPWTPEELKEVRSAIEDDVHRLQSEIQLAESDLVDLMRDSNDGAGDDQADAGAKTFEREQEITLANNTRDMLIQALHALERLEDGTYGVCESCGNAIGKLRLQAAPRATLCVACKTKQERR